MEKKPKRARKPRPIKGVEFTVWSLNGGPISEEAVHKLETALDVARVELFNDGIRTLSQTNRA